MKNKKRRWRKGDVFRVRLDASYRYLQYGGRLQPLNIDAFRVVEFASGVPIDDTEQITCHPTAYWICSDCSILVSDSHFEFVGAATMQENLPPMRMASFGRFTIYENGAQTAVLHELDDSSASLSIIEVLPPAVILQRLSSDWRPSHDRNDAIALLRNVSMAPQDRRSVSFFIDFANQLHIDDVAKILQQDGYTVVSSGARTLTATRALLSSDTIDKVEAEITRIVQRRSGSVVGHEISL